MRQTHKNATCYATDDAGKTITETFVLSNPNHRKELLARLAAVAVGETEVKRLTIDFND